MTRKQALEIVTNVCNAYLCNLQDRSAIQQALTVLRTSQTIQEDEVDTENPVDTENNEDN